MTIKTERLQICAETEGGGTDGSGETGGNSRPTAPLWRVDDGGDSGRHEGASVPEGRADPLRPSGTPPADVRLLPGEVVRGELLAGELGG